MFRSDLKVPKFIQNFDECELRFVFRGVPHPSNAASMSGTAVDRLMWSANLENEEKLKTKLESSHKFISSYKNCSDVESLK